MGSSPYPGDLRRKDHEKALVAVLEMKAEGIEVINEIRDIIIENSSMIF